jgi:hypothetical protein
MTKRRITWLVANAVLGFALLAGSWFVVIHRQDFIDWWRLRTYKPSDQIVQLADATTMVGRGRDMFYVSEPRVERRSSFNQDCDTANEQGAVLGCYTYQNIYLFDVSDPRLPGVKEVTAAHEMLHAAYERLDDTTKNRIDSLLQAELSKLTGDADLQNVIALYQKSEPGELLNEMHSILGTEYGNLSPELEQYYTQYFTDRSKVVALAQGYKSVFTASKTQIAAYQRQLDSIKKQIDSNTSQLEQMNQQITSGSAQLDDLRRSDPVAYNQRVPGFNAQVNAYNSLARSTQALVNQYNSIVVQLNNEAALQTDLNHSLDSRYQPVNRQ